MPAPVQGHGTIETISEGGAEGTLKPDGGGNDVLFKNPVQFEIVKGEGVSYLSITNPQTGETSEIINGKD